MPTTHVLFDFFGTLVAHSESRVEQGFQHSHEVLLRSGARIDYAKFLEDWSRTFDEFETRAQQSLDEYSMDDVCGQFLSRVLPGDPDQETVALFRDTYLREWNKGVRYIPGVRELIAELAASFTLVLVTNTHHPALVHDHLHCMGVEDHFATVVTSVEHGKRKPSAHIFCAALERSAGNRKRASSSATHSRQTTLALPTQAFEACSSTPSAVTKSQTPLGSCTFWT